MGKVRESPPYIVNTPEDGFFRVGLTTDAKTDRPDQVALGAGSGGCLRIFEDGGWELRSHNSSGNPNKKGCNLLADGEGPLLIKSESNIYIDCPNGDFRVNAKNIVMNATGADDGDITFNATRDIQIDADNNVGRICPIRSPTRDPLIRAMSARKGTEISPQTVLRVWGSV